MSNPSTVNFVKSITGNSVKDNGATVLWGGNIPTGSRAVTNAPGQTLVATTRYNVKVPLPTETTSDFTHKSLTGGDFTNIHKGSYLIVGFSTSIAAVANNLLRSPASNYSRRPSYIEAIRTRRQSLTGWNYVTGALLGSPTVAADTFESIDNSANIDAAARSSRTSPGDFQYMFGAIAPKRTTYPARTG